jgi:hypothetical protein
VLFPEQSPNFGTILATSLVICQTKSVYFVIAARYAVRIGHDLCQDAATVLRCSKTRECVRCLHPPASQPLTR